MSRGTRTFIRHYVEMGIAMFVAMLLRRNEYARSHKDHAVGEATS
jgi:hypothetical protein